MTLRHMKIFTVVADCESITLAAEKLYLAQPAVSLAIKELEDYYGTHLFDRLSRRIYITESGKQLLSYARHIVSVFDEMEQTMKNSDKSGILRIGSSVTIGTQFIPIYIKEFHNQYPDVKINVQIDSSEQIEEKLLKNELDFGLIEGIVHSEYIISQKYMDDELAAVCGKSHRFAEMESVDISEFIKEPLLMRERGSGTRELFDNIVSSAEKSYTPSWESISTDALINGVIEGNGVSVLPLRLVQKKIDDGFLSRVFIKNCTMKRAFYIVYHKNKFISPVMQKFIFHICDEKYLKNH